MSVAAIKHWIIISLDVKTAFLQRNDLDHFFYLKPSAEAENGQGKVCKLLKPVYVLCNASRRWCL